MLNVKNNVSGYQYVRYVPFIKQYGVCMHFYSENRGKYIKNGILTIPITGEGNLCGIASYAYHALYTFHCPCTIIYRSLYALLIGPQTHLSMRRQLLVTLPLKFPLWCFLTFLDIIRRKSTDRLRLNSSNFSFQKITSEIICTSETLSKHYCQAYVPQIFWHPR